MVAVMGNPKPVLDHEPEAVEYARRKAGLTKTQLAQRLGVSLPLISMIEKGTRNATPELLLNMAEALNCPVVILERKRHCCRPAPDPADEPEKRQAAA